MNTNLIHNILNVLIALVSAFTAFLVASGCTTAAGTGALDCSQSWIAPEAAALVASGLAVTKTIINLFRDGLSGLVKHQPPVA